jgi:hypothetical protein
LTINHLPDELVLEIFDYYRQGIDPYDLQWRKKHVWIYLTHVCRKWRAVIFASYSRLDLGITVGPEKPEHIKTILSGPLPISIDYKSIRRDITGSALWRLRATLQQHHHRVREIAFKGSSANFEKLLKMAQRDFPVLESLILQFEFLYEAKLPDTFLRGPDLSDLRLRRISLRHVSLASISGFLLSATAVTDLALQFDTSFSPSPEASLLTCLQGMPCLRRLDLSMSFGSPFQPPTTPTGKDMVRLSKLTGLFYLGYGVFLENLVAGLSAPSLRDVGIEFYDDVPSIVHLPRFINEIEEHYHAVHMTFEDLDFSFSLQTQLEYNNHCKPRFRLVSVPGDVLQSIIRMSDALSTRLSTVEELRVTFDWAPDDSIPWRELLQHFPSVKVFRAEGASSYYRIARALLQDHGDPGDNFAFLSALEEIELGKLTDKSQRGCELVAFEPFVSARQQAGRPVKVFFNP